MCVESGGLALYSGMRKPGTLKSPRQADKLSISCAAAATLQRPVDRQCSMEVVLTAVSCGAFLLLIIWVERSENLNKFCGVEQIWKAASIYIFYILGMRSERSVALTAFTKIR